VNLEKVGTVRGKKIEDRKISTERKRGRNKREEKVEGERGKRNKRGLSKLIVGQTGLEKQIKKKINLNNLKNKN
jgi:hypothetical protein